MAAGKFQLDTGSDFGRRVERRLREDALIWLTTVGPDGTPYPSPVWFLWDGQTVLLYSRPHTPKLRNISRNPRVALHLDGDGRGGDIVVINGEARIDREAPPVDQVPGYVAKYGGGGFFARMGATPESMARDYSVAVRVTPSKLRGH
jgi:PPOX class probable F420-dependent enzyme